MRTLIAAVMMIMLAAYAYAQIDVPGSPKSRGGGSGPQKDAPTYHVTEKDYNAALKRVPDSKEKFDPWGGVRETPSPKNKSR